MWRVTCPAWGSSSQGARPHRSTTVSFSPAPPGLKFTIVNKLAREILDHHMILWMTPFADIVYNPSCLDAEIFHHRARVPKTILRGRVGDEVRRVEAASGIHEAAQILEAETDVRL